MRALGTTEFKVGLFTVIALVVLGYMFFVLSPALFERTDVKTYHTILDDAAGIVTKTHVKTNGVTVGKVESVDLENNKTRITFTVDASVNIPVGSKVEIRTRGLLGDVFLEIKRAPDSGEYIPNKGLIPISDDTVDLQGLITAVGGIAQDLKAIVKENRENLRAFLEDLSATTATLRKVLGNKETELVEIVDNVHEFTYGLKEVLDSDNREKIDRILASFDDSMGEVKAATRNIKLIAERVERGEGTLGRLVNDDKTLTEIEGAIKDLRQVLSPAMSLQIGIDYHGELRKDDTNQHYFNVKFQTRPDRFYLIGFTDHEYEVVDKTVTPLTGEDPGSTRTVERIKTERAIRFNLQMAKRWYFFGVRGGLFESTGGFATDFYLLRDRVHFALEAFDWKSKNNPLRRTAHFKTYASILFYDHVYALAGIDDLTRLDPVTQKTADPNYFMGAGLSFTDQDLKALFGAAALAR